MQLKYRVIKDLSIDKYLIQQRAFLWLRSFTIEHWRTVYENKSEKLANKKFDFITNTGIDMLNPDMIRTFGL